MISPTFDIPGPGRQVLLVNPPVDDYSDFKLEYCEPTGLLKLATLLKERSVAVTLVDCLAVPAPRAVHGWSRRGGTVVLRRHFGMTLEELEVQLARLGSTPDEVWVTAFATFWYDSVRETITTIRRCFPSARIVVGGVYPTLLPEHADRVLGADVVVAGEVPGARERFADPALAGSRGYVGLKPAYGCPHDCSYCAQRTINKGRMSTQEPSITVDEMERHVQAGVSSFLLFSENFLFNRRHFTAILDEVLRRRLRVTLGAPKGMEPRLLDRELLERMRSAGWKGIRLALETTSSSQRRNLGRLHDSVADYERAISAAQEGGFSVSEIGTFLLYGTPGERLEDVAATAEFIHSSRSYVIPMAFTPVPGSRLYGAHRERLARRDLRELNGHLFPFAEYNGYCFEDYLAMGDHIAELNRRLKGAERSDVVGRAGRGWPAFADSELRLALGQ